MSETRQPTENEMGLHAVLNNGYLAPEIRNVRMWEFIEAIINENMGPELSRARAEALEEAKAGLVKRKDAAKELGMMGRAQVFHDAAECVGALIALPAPATIPVEKVRVEARRLITQHLTSEAEVRAVATLADSLGANVDDLVPHEWIGAAETRHG